MFVGTERLFFVLPTNNRHGAILEFLLEEFVHCECDGLTGRHSHDSRRDSFVEGVESFLSMFVHPLAKSLHQYANLPPNPKTTNPSPNPNPKTRTLL